MSWHSRCPEIHETLELQMQLQTACTKLFSPLQLSEFESCLDDLEKQLKDLKARNVELQGEIDRLTGARSADSIEQEAREKWEAEQAEKLKSLSEEVRIYILYGIVKGPLKPRCEVLYFYFSCSMSDALRKTVRSTTKRCSC